MTEIIELIEEKTVSIENSAFLNNLFGEKYRTILTSSTPLILFGCGSAGKELLPLLLRHGVRPHCYCDNDKLKVGKRFQGYTVISFECLTTQYPDCYILLTMGSSASYSVRQDLMQAEVSASRVFSIRQDYLNFYTNIERLYWHWDVLVNAHHRLQKVYDLLTDWKSKKYFVTRLSLLTGGADFLAYVDFLKFFSEIEINEKYLDRNIHFENELYFQNEELVLNDGEIYLDLGAYIGDSVRSFISSCREKGVSYNHIYCLEPDPDNYLELSNYVSRVHNITCYNLGAYSHPDELRFIASGGESCLSENENGIIVKFESVDSLFKEENISLIKMDVEGAEIAVLHGAKQLIQRCRPKLIISVYHKKEDLIEVPLFLSTICKNYKYHLKHFSNNFTEAVLYAVPD